MLCPLCHVEHEPALQISTIAVCGNCGGSVYAGVPMRPAVALDLDALAPSDVQALKKARGKIARPERRQ